MNDYLKQRENAYISGQITQYKNLINSTGALTIVDNTDNSDLELVPNSMNIFLDQLFIAGGHGFSSYSDYTNAAYVISSFDGVCSYLLDYIEQQGKISLDYYSDNINSYIFNPNYNSYNILSSYTYFSISNNANSYIISAYTADLLNINNIQISYSINNVTYNYTGDSICREINTNITLSYLFSLSETVDETNLNANKALSTWPTIAIDFDNNGFKECFVNFDTILHNNLYGSHNYNSDIPDSKTIKLAITNNNKLLYQTEYKDIIKWCYKIAYFDVDILHELNKIDKNTSDSIKRFNDYNNILLSTLEETNNNQIKSELENLCFSFPDDKFELLDNQLELTFNGGIYSYNNQIEYSHDYIIIKGNKSDNINIYFNNILCNNWEKLNISHENYNYIILQSPQKYIGKHTWTIKYE